MSDWDHMGRVADGAIRFGCFSGVVILILLPLAIWKVVDIVIWMVDR